MITFIVTYTAICTTHIPFYYKEADIRQSTFKTVQEAEKFESALIYNSDETCRYKNITVYRKER